MSIRDGIYIPPQGQVISLEIFLFLVRIESLPAERASAFQSIPSSRYNAYSARTVQGDHRKPPQVRCGKSAFSGVPLPPRSGGNMRKRQRTKTAEARRTCFLIRIYILYSYLLLECSMISRTSASA